MGNVAMMNGMTGELLQHSVFMAPVHYKRLRHMVQDKEYTRARGAVNSITRQLTEGRSKGGGLRFGEMERDAVAGSGSALFVKDRLHENSDAHKTTLCSSCGLFGIVRSSTGFRCSDSRCVGGSIVTVTVPYALELFFKELMSMNITPRIKVQL
jgi:DNA-directed RNA polymerase II subunit RPB2